LKETSSAEGTEVKDADSLLPVAHDGELVPNMSSCERPTSRKKAPEQEAVESLIPELEPIPEFEPHPPINQAKRPSGKGNRRVRVTNPAEERAAIVTAAFYACRLSYAGSVQILEQGEDMKQEAVESLIPELEPHPPLHQEKRPSGNRNRKVRVTNPAEEHAATVTAAFFACRLGYQSSVQILKQAVVSLSLEDVVAEVNKVSADELAARLQELPQDAKDRLRKVFAIFYPTMETVPLSSG
jgi:hypothetical protein